MATLKITVHEARDLPVMDRASGLADPYTVLRLDDMEHTTEIARRTRNPVWNRDYRFDAPDLLVLQEDPLQVRVYDHDIISRDDLVGTVWVDCNLFIYRRTPVVSGWFPLMDTIEGVRGEIRLTIRVKFHGSENPMRPLIPERFVRRLDPSTVIAAAAAATTTGTTAASAPVSPHDVYGTLRSRGGKFNKHAPLAARGDASFSSQQQQPVLGRAHGRTTSATPTTAPSLPAYGLPSSSLYQPTSGSFDVSSVHHLLSRLGSSPALFDQGSFSYTAFSNSTGNLPGLLESGNVNNSNNSYSAGEGGGGGDDAHVLGGSASSALLHQTLLPFFCESDMAPIPAVRAQQPSLAGEEESVLMFSVWRLDPAILRVERVASMVEELIVKADPEHSRMTNLRSSRSTHEARVTQLFKLSGKVRRQLSRKVVELQCNAVLGYTEAFDIEPSSIIVRAYGTPCVVSAVRYVEEHAPRPLLHAASSQLSLWNSFTTPPTTFPTSPQPHTHSRTGSQQPNASLTAAPSTGSSTQPSAHHGGSAGTAPVTAAAAQVDAQRHAELLPPPAATAAVTLSAPQQSVGSWGDVHDGGSLVDKADVMLPELLNPLPEVVSQPLRSPRAPTEVPSDSRQQSRTSPPLMSDVPALITDNEGGGDAHDPSSHLALSDRSPSHTMTPIPFHPAVVHAAAAAAAAAAAGTTPEVPVTLLSHVHTPSSTANNSFVDSIMGLAQPGDAQGRVLTPKMVHALPYGSLQILARTPHMTPMTIEAGNSPYGALLVGEGAVTGPSLISHTTAPPTATQSEMDFAAALGNSTSRLYASATTAPTGPMGTGALPLLPPAAVATATAAVSPSGSGAGAVSGAGGGAGGAAAGPALASSRSAVLILTMKDLPSDAVLHIGGHICSRSVKIVSKLKSKQIISQERDAWWMELREELRANARSFHCNAILGYEEETQYLEDVVLLSLYGTAVMVDVSLISLRAGPDLIYRRARDKIETRRNCSLLHLYHGSQHRAAMMTDVGDVLHHSTCNVCHHKPVPDVLLASCTLPVDLSCEGPPRLVHVTVSRQKHHDIKGTVLATTVSQALPFLEYSLHKQLMFQLRLMGLNACFGMRVSIILGPDAMVGTLTGTGCRLVGLPTPLAPRLEVLDPSIARSETVMRLKDVIIKRSQARAWRKRQRERRQRRERRERRRRSSGASQGHSLRSSSDSDSTVSQASSSGPERRATHGSKANLIKSRTHNSNNNNNSNSRGSGQSGSRQRHAAPSPSAARHRRGNQHQQQPQQPTKGVNSHPATHSNSAKTSHVQSVVASSRASLVPSAASSTRASSRARAAGSAFGSRASSRSSRASQTASSSRSSSSRSSGSRSSATSDSHSTTSDDSTWMHSLTDSDSSDELPYRPVQEALNSRIVDYVVKVDDEEEADLMLGMADETTFEDSILLTIPYVADSAIVFDWQERIIMHRRYSIISTVSGNPWQATSSVAPVFLAATDDENGLRENGGGGPDGANMRRFRAAQGPRFTNRVMNECCADAKRAFVQTVCRVAMRHDARPERLRVFNFATFTFFEPHSGDLHLRLEGTLMLSSASGRLRLVKLEDRAFRVCLQSALLADPITSDRASSAMASPVTGGSAGVNGAWDLGSLSSYNNAASSLPSTTTPVALRTAGSGAGVGTDGTSESYVRGSITASTSPEHPPVTGPGAGGSASQSAPPVTSPLGHNNNNNNSNGATASFGLHGLSRSSPEYLIYHFYRRLFTSRTAPFSLPYTIDPRSVAPLRVWAGGGVTGSGGDATDWSSARVMEEEDRRTYADYRDNKGTRKNAVTRHVQSFFAAASNSLRSLAERTSRNLRRDGSSTRRRVVRDTTATATTTTTTVAAAAGAAGLSASNRDAGASMSGSGFGADSTDRLSLGPSGVTSGATMAVAADTSLHQPARRLPRDLKTLAEWLPPVIITPVDYVAGRAIVRYLGRLSHHFIREEYDAGAQPGGSNAFPTTYSSSTQSPLGAFFQKTELEIQCCVEALVRLAGGNALLKHCVTVHEVSDSDGSGSAFLFVTVTGDIVQVADLATVPLTTVPSSPPTAFTTAPMVVAAATTTMADKKDSARAKVREEQSRGRVGSAAYDNDSDLSAEDEATTA